jgi:menaquinol-cytochrome c reductase iron-sulfur subunit
MSELSRRDVLMKLGILLNAAIAAVLAIPVVGYVLAPLLARKGGSYTAWVKLGSVDQFPEGQTRLATFRNPFVRSWDGQTGDIPCWVRHVSGESYQVFAINCAHLGCPVRWFAQSGLFMCPCHGGVYYADGSRASGPPERGLFEYEYKVDGNQLVIRTGELPTLATQASITTGNKPCAG